MPVRRSGELQLALELPHLQRIAVRGHDIEPVLANCQVVRVNLDRMHATTAGDLPDGHRRQEILQEHELAVGGNGDAAAWQTLWERAYLAPGFPVPDNGRALHFTAHHD